MTVQNISSIGLVDHIFTNVPAPILSKSVNFQKIIVVLNGDKKSERILPRALNVAREHQAELLIVHTHPAKSREQVELYLKGIKNKLKIEYNAVQVCLSDAKDEFTTLKFALDGEKQTCVMVGTKRRNYLQRLLSGTLFGDLVNHENVHLHEVDLTY